jgi:hypothetical protein
MTPNVSNPATKRPHDFLLHFSDFRKLFMKPDHADSIALKSSVRCANRLPHMALAHSVSRSRSDSVSQQEERGKK